jgi:proline iminopeptidase
MRVDIGGATRLYFDVDGPGLVPDGPTMRERPTLLLLHGGPGFDHSTFKPAFSQLTDLVQVVYLDHRGQGRSDRGTPDQWHLETWADDVVRFCDAIGIEHPIVLGNSFGGMVAMAYASRHPQHPAKLVLSSTAARKSPARIYAMFEQLGGDDARAVAERFWEGDRSPESVEDYWRVCMPLYTVNRGTLNEGRTRTIFNTELMNQWGVGEGSTFDLIDDLARITCPTLVLAGELDPVCPVADSEDIVAALRPDLVRLEVVPSCGHGSFRDAPEHTFAVLREFLAT